MGKMISKLLKQLSKASSHLMVRELFMRIIIEPEWDDVSSEAKDLVKKLLTYDPVKRISASEAL